VPPSDSYSPELAEKLKEFAGGIDPDGREASFDYCFNYFQTFLDSGNISELATRANLQISCLQLGFFLASWGMYRGSTDVFQKSVRYLAPVVRVIAACAPQEFRKSGARCRNIKAWDDSRGAD
jgi:hypothetical protein